MKTELLRLFGVLSFLMRAAFLAYAVWQAKRGGRAKQVLSPVQVYTVGVFLSVVLLFIPVYYTGYCFGDAYSYIRPVLLAVHNSLRVFILDGDFDIIVKVLKCQPLRLRVLFALHAACLYVIAPVLTFSNVLSLFKNLRGELRYHYHKRKSHYIMSELNAKSVALAKSIREKYQNDAVIVFTDVFEQNEEDDYELLTEVREMNAICLKKDIAHINIFSKKGNVELFLIGEDESENVSQAVKITTELDKKNGENNKKWRIFRRNKYNVKVFVFSQSPSGAYILDSIQYDCLLQHAAGDEYGEKSFKLRRINEKQQLIWNSVPKMKLFEVAQRHNRTLSVLIVGFGSYGSEFFKTLLWYCQFEGYRLEINVVDKQSASEGEKSPVRSQIDRMCPELMRTNCLEQLGEAQYDIQIIPGVDMENADFDDLLHYSGEDAEKKRLSDRLKATNVVLVALGDDDRNIEVAVHVRGLFDRVHGIKAKDSIQWKDEAVDIYAVVYDDHKSGILAKDPAKNVQRNALINHKEVPYHIHFLGGMSAQFRYDNLYDSKLEKCAYAHHRSWVDAEESIYHEWIAAGEQKKVEAHDWYCFDQKTEEAAAQADQWYQRFEYYRLSSIAKELYKREINGNKILKNLTTCSEGGALQTCDCKKCVRRKRSEHMRWNAYTRTIGYMYSDKMRADRAKLHDNLLRWDQLDELDQLKD